MTYREISELMGIKSKTVESTVRNHRRNKYQLVLKRKNCGRPRPHNYSSIIDIIKRQETLQKWAGLTLKERCRVLRFEHDLIVKPHTLRLYYKVLKIKYCRIQLEKANKFAKEQEIKAEQFAFCLELFKSITEHKSVFYIDETSFNLWATPRKVWQYDSKPIKISQSDSRGGGFTLIGALGGANYEFIYQIFDTTNAKNISAFICNLRKKKPSDKILIILDNHRAHRSILFKDELKRQEIDVLYLPPYSCQLNSIERLWAEIKRQWRIKILKTMGKVTVGEGKELLKWICETIKVNNLKNIFFSNKHAILNCMEGELV